MNTPANQKNQERAEKPAHEIRLGRIKVSLWANRSDNALHYNATVCRLYRMGDAWHTSDSFGRDELPLVIKALDMAHTWMLTTGANSPSSREGFDLNGSASVSKGGHHDNR